MNTLETHTQRQHFRNVVCIADLHYPRGLSADPVTAERFRRWEDALFASGSIGSDTLMVIAGDVMHDYDRADPFLVTSVLSFLEKVRDTAGEVVVVLGNHDYNHVTGQSWIPLAARLGGARLFEEGGQSETPRTRHTGRLNLLLASGAYRFGDVRIDFQSITDPFESYFYEHRDDARDPDAALHLALFHGIIQGSKIRGLNRDTSKVTEYAVRRDWFDAHDLVLLGHIHQHQCLHGKFIYTGSVMQHSFGEEIDGHGFVEIDTASRRWVFHELPPVLAFVTVQYHHPPTTDSPPILALPAVPATVRYMSVQIATTTAVVAADRQSAETVLRAKLPTDITVVSCRWKRVVDFASMTDGGGAADTDGADAGKDDDCAAAGAQPSPASSVGRPGLVITRCAWSNVFCYGPEESEIVFDDTVKTISANNTYGKTTVWRIIIVALYADAFRAGEKKSYMENIVNAQATRGRIVLDGAIDGQSFRVERTFSRGQRTVVRSVLTVRGESFPTKWLVDRLMPLDVLRSNYVLARNSESIFEKSSTRLQQFMNITFHLDELQARAAEVERSITADKAAANALRKVLATLPPAPDPSGIVAKRTELAALVEPTNPVQEYVTYNSKEVRDLSAAKTAAGGGGDPKPVLVTADEFAVLVNFLKGHANTKADGVPALLEMAEHRGLLAAAAAEPGDTLTTAAAVRRARTLLDFAELATGKDSHAVSASTALASLEPVRSALAPALRDLLERCTTLVQLAKPFFAAYGTSTPLPTIGAGGGAELVSLDACEYFLKHEDPRDTTSFGSKKVVVSDPFAILPPHLELPTASCRYPTSVQRLNKLVRESAANTEFLRTVTAAMTDNRSDEVRAILERLRNDDDAVQLLRAPVRPPTAATPQVSAAVTKEEAAAAAEAYRVSRRRRLGEVLASVRAHALALRDRAAAAIPVDMLQKRLAAIDDKLTTFAFAAAVAVAETRKRFQKDWRAWSERSSQLEVEISNGEQLLANHERIGRDLLEVQSRLDALLEERNRLNDRRVKILEHDVHELEDMINAELSRYVQLQIRLEPHETAQKLQFSLAILDGDVVRSFDHLSGYERVIASFVTMHAFNTLGDWRFNVFYIDEAFDVLDADNFANLDDLLHIAHMATPNVLFVTHRPVSSQRVITIRRDAAGRSRLVCGDAPLYR